MPRTLEELSDINRRTTGAGMFNFADDYLKCAKQLDENKPAGLRFGDPIEFLYFQSIELYLKSFLRQNGYCAWTLGSRSFGHDFEKLLDACLSKGMVADAKTDGSLRFVARSGSQMQSKYIATGPRQTLPRGDLRAAADAVRAAVLPSVSAELAAAAPYEVSIEHTTSTQSEI